jgi:hypothetical protein
MLGARCRRLLGREGGFRAIDDRPANVGRGFALSTVTLAQAGFGHAGRVAGKGTRRTTNILTTLPMITGHDAFQKPALTV